MSAPPFSKLNRSHKLLHCRARLIALLSLRTGLKVHCIVVVWRSIDFFEVLGLREVRRRADEKGRCTNVFLAAPGDEVAPLELT